MFGLIVLVELLGVGAAAFFDWDWWVAGLGVAASIIWFDLYSGGSLSDQFKVGSMSFVFRVVGQATGLNAMAWLLGCGLSVLL
jgi:hypothetical protein